MQWNRYSSGFVLLVSLGCGGQTPGETGRVAPSSTGAAGATAAPGVDLGGRSFKFINPRMVPNNPGEVCPTPRGASVIFVDHDDGTYSAISWLRGRHGPFSFHDLQARSGWSDWPTNPRPALATDDSSSVAFPLDAQGRPAKFYNRLYFAFVEPEDPDMKSCHYEAELIPDLDGPEFEVISGPLPWSPIEIWASKGLMPDTEAPAVTLNGVALSPLVNEHDGQIAGWHFRVGDWLPFSGALLQIDIPPGVKDAAGYPGKGVHLETPLLTLGSKLSPQLFGSSFEGAQHPALHPLPPGSDGCPEGCLRFDGQSLHEPTLLLAGQIEAPGTGSLRLRYRLAETSPGCDPPVVQFKMFSPDGLWVGDAHDLADVGGESVWESPFEHSPWQALGYELRFEPGSCAAGLAGYDLRLLSIETEAK